MAVSQTLCTKSSVKHGWEEHSVTVLSPTFAVYIIDPTSATVASSYRQKHHITRIEQYYITTTNYYITHRISK